MRRRNQGFLDVLIGFLIEAPWWMGPIVVAAVYAFFRLLLPAVIGATSGSDDSAAARTMSSTLSSISVGTAPYFAGGTGFVWLIALLFKFRDRDRFESQTGLDSIQNLSWAAFERLVGEFYRRQGYQVEITGSNSGDGGVDLVLRRNREITLVQCKHWRAHTVGVKPVRELLGVMTSEKAQFGIMVTSGSFSADAIAFAAKTGIRLIDGPELEGLIRTVQRAGKSPSVRPEGRVEPASVSQDHPPSCPSCGAVMKKRTARQGAHAGKTFWGCSKYPACRGIREI